MKKLVLGLLIASSISTASALSPVPPKPTSPEGVTALGTPIYYGYLDSSSDLEMDDVYYMHDKDVKKAEMTCYNKYFEAVLVKPILVKKVGDDVLTYSMSGKRAFIGEEILANCIIQTY